MKTYLSNYLGIVVQNNDPEKRGRVKVWVPHISTAVYENWNKDFSGATDKCFIFPDKVTNPDLDAILPYLKESLPWSEVALSIFGGSATGRYNAFSGKGTTSDSNTDKPGFRPLQNFVGDNQITDAFPDNPNTKGYTPSNYSNLARGEFTIPNVGAHVWVFFIEGDSNYPVVWAVSHGEEDWKRIYTTNNNIEDTADATSADYPASYENLATSETPDGQTNKNIQTFRAKHVFNSNKHSLELIDTDKSEVLKFTHYSGSFLEFNNATTSRFASNNDQSLILGDQYLTVRKDQNIYIANYQNTTIGGDRVTKLGDFDNRRILGVQILDIMRNTHQYKRLFELQRAKTEKNHNSKFQMRSGEFADCPVCAGEGMKFGDDCVTCKGTGKNPSSIGGEWTLEPIKQKVLLQKDLQKSTEMFIASNVDSISPLALADLAVKLYDPMLLLWYKENGTGMHSVLEHIMRVNQRKIDNLQLESEFGNGGDDIALITGNKVTTIGAVFNDLESYRVDLKGKITPNGTHVAKQGLYVTMGASPLVEYVDVDSVPGGDWDVVVGNKYRLNVGSKGIHIKTTGPMDIYGSIVNMSAEALYVTAEHEAIIESKSRLELRAAEIEIKPEKEVLINGNVGVTGNIKTAGGVHIEGELSYISSTAVKQMYMTEIGYGPWPHTHIFYGPKCEYFDDPAEIRESAAAMNDNGPVPNKKNWSVWIPT